VTADSERTALQQRAAELERDRDAAVAALVEAEARARQTQAETDTRAASEAEALKTDLARARADLATELDRQRIGRGALVPAIRHVFVDAMGRMVRREVAKAKNYQANPLKLSAWIDSYYDQTEEELFTEALLPAMRLHLASINSVDDPVEASRAVVREHFEESKKALGLIVDAGHDGFGELLQRMLHNWEVNRADRLADRVMRTEIENGR
jgi:hypothetical protein